MTERNVASQDAEEVVGADSTVPTTAEAQTPSQDPDTGADQVQAEQEAVAAQEPSGDGSAAGAPPAAAGAAAPADDASPLAEASPVADDTALAAERLADLQRLQAEYVNYKRRVDRDRAVVQERAAQSVVEALLPVLDDIHAAREHGDLEGGPFAAIADKLETTLGKFGLERYGAVGEEFDPSLHEALMHTAWPQDESVASTGSTTVVQVLQPGYRAGERILRAARVAVADPE
ncbi:nucleotide exchange factor GrpE [Pedococcus sp. 5OH_020]|uniref:nucleotide exchange factor GrpE n=1 Tax=Pedococcus sp. 5OH_020 TaxID=2989814 RepID=UPI0022E9C8AF|nr:nucleotide exchange factor GrpE [Pedococcus sp. 5OH_020]